MNRKHVLISGLILLLISIGLTVRVQKVEASGTIYIRANGLVEGTDKITSVDNITYTFTESINDSIVVERINIIIDGAGYMLNGTGTGSYVGLTVEYVDFPANDNVTIQNVTIIGFGVGIGLISTEVNKIFGCTITNNTYGIWGTETMNNTISGNIITNNSYGIYFNTGFFTDICGNNITNNDYGVWLEFSTDNKFYHNFFVDNTNQTYIEQGNANTWDDGYPSGGNYWSDFEERYPGVEDIYSGPGQNETGSDGFWDGPYEMNEDNIDHYPIVPEFPSFLILPLFIMATLLAVIACRRKHFM